MTHNAEQNTAIESKISVELCCGSWVISPPVANGNILWGKGFKRAAGNFFLIQEFSKQASQESLRLFSPLLVSRMESHIAL